MKFYYNGQLMRTSKNHNYTHAVVIEDEKGLRCYGCHKDAKGCEAEINRSINECLRGIDNANEALKALAAGKDGYYAKDGRGRRWFTKFKNTSTVEFYNNWINDNKAYIDTVRRTWKVVELEAR